MAETMLQTQMKQIGLIFLLLTLLLNSVSENLWAQTETLNSGRPQRPPWQANPERRTARGVRTPAQAEISTGFVFLNGQYLCPPYTIALAGGDVSLNGVRLPTLSLARSSQRAYSQGRGGRMPSQRLVGWLRQPEMNPFAGYVLDVPAMVVCFKLGLTLGPAILLILARRRKLAQMASWWGGVLYTVLVLRWGSYNAMFMH